MIRVAFSRTPIRRIESAFRYIKKGSVDRPEEFNTEFTVTYDNWNKVPEAVMDRILFYY